MKLRGLTALVLVLVFTGAMEAQTINLPNGMVLDKYSVAKHPGSSALSFANLAEDWYGGQGLISAPSGSTVYFHTNGAIKKLTLANNMSIPGGPVAKARTDVLFLEDGSISRINLAYDFEIGPGLVAQAGRIFEYSSSGSIAYFVPKYDIQVAEQFWAKAGEGLAFHDNGNVRYFTLARPGRDPDGFAFLAGMTVGLSDSGMLSYAHFTPPSEYTEPYTGLVTKAGSELFYDFKTDNVTLVPARDQTNSATGASYKAGTKYTIKL